MKNFWIKIPSGYKKAFATAVGSFLMAFFDRIGLDVVQAQTIVTLIGVYILGQSHVDAKKYASESNPTITKV